MRNRKKWISVLATVIVVALIGVAGVMIAKRATHDQPIGNGGIPEDERIHVKVNKSFSSWEGITADSDFIVVASVGELKEVATVEQGDGWYFPITELTVLDSLKGNLPEGANIDLLQTRYVAEDPPVQEGETVLLFLKKFSGPQTDDPNTYVCNGLYGGHYKIQGERVVESYIRDGDPGNSMVKDGKLWGVEPKLSAVTSTVESLVAAD